MLDKWRVSVYLVIPTYISKFEQRDNLDSSRILQNGSHLPRLDLGRDIRKWHFASGAPSGLLDRWSNDI